MTTAFRLRRVSSEAAWAAAGLFVQVAGQVLVLKLVTTLLARAQFGSLALLNSACALVQVFLLAPLVQGALRQAPRCTAEGTLDALLEVAAGLSKVIWRVVLGVTLVLLAVAVATQNLAALALVLSALAMLYADYRSSMTQSLQHVSRLRSLLAAHRMVETVARAGMVAFVLYLRPETVVVPLAFATASLLVNAIFEPMTRRRLRVQQGPASTSLDPVETRRQIVQFGGPLALASLATWAQTSADRWFVEHSGSLAEAGRYAAAGQISAAPFNILAGLLLTFAGPILYARADARDARVPRWLLLMGWAYLAAGAVGLGLLIWGKSFFVHLLLGAAQWDAEPLVPITALGWMLFQASQLPTLALMVAGSTQRLLVPYALAGVTSAILNAILVPRLGAVGASWALVASGSVRLATLAWAGRLAMREWAASPKSEANLDNSPERITPTQETLAEFFRVYPDHQQRYAFALQFTAGKRVADIACGVGYGTFLLAKTATDIKGFDVSEDALAHARSHFAAPNARFLQAAELPEGEFEVVISFETLEHMSEEDGDAFLGRIKRSLVPGGRLVMSTPINKTEHKHHVTPFHIREYSDDEFPAKLARNGFQVEEMFGQGGAFHARLHGPGPGARFSLFKVMKLGVHRLLPGFVRARLKRALLGDPNEGLGIRKENWRNMAVQIAVCRAAP